MFHAKPFRRFSMGELFQRASETPVRSCETFPMQRRLKNTPYRLAIALTLAASLLLVWLSLGVGIIGKDGDPANVMYFAVLAVGIVGAIMGRFRPRGMARALFAMAIGQALVATIALLAELGLPWSGPAEILLLNGFFIAQFVAAAWLFRRADKYAEAQVGDNANGVNG